MYELPKELEFNDGIGIIGPLPPPIGGVSTHLKRFTDLHPNSKVFNTSKLIKSKIIFLIKIWFFFKKNKTIIIHDISNRVISAVIIVSLFKSCKLIPYIHNSRFHENNSKLRNLLLKLLFRKSSFILTVRQMEKSTIISYKIKNIVTRNAYLPPKGDEYEILISTCAFQLAEYNGKDLYGIDICIEGVNILIKEGLSVKLLIAIANTKYRSDYLSLLKRKVYDYQLTNHVFFLEGQVPFWPIIKESSIFIRATNTDGDSISIREAINFKTTVLASDASPRPTECKLFKNRNVFSMVKQLREILSNEV